MGCMKSASIKLSSLGAGIKGLYERKDEVSPKEAPVLAGVGCRGVKVGEGGRDRLLMGSLSGTTIEGDANTSLNTAGSDSGTASPLLVTFTVRCMAMRNSCRFNLPSASTSLRVQIKRRSPVLAPDF
jgi:hypothetical protein